MKMKWNENRIKFKEIEGLKIDFNKEGGEFKKEKRKRKRKIERERGKYEMIMNL